MQEFTNEEMLQIIDKLRNKTIEVVSLMKDGKIIVAYEKLGGILKNLNTCHTELLSCVTQSSVATNVDNK
jgi:hypothetical protein